jgi:hypothetical protein
VASLQEQIRQQHALIAETGKAIRYNLATIKNQPELMKFFFLTESHAMLVTALAQMMREPREKIADRYGAHHSPYNCYGCIDDPE